MISIIFALVWLGIYLFKDVMICHWFWLIVAFPIEIIFWTLFSIILGFGVFKLFDRWG